jgi:hypothetical protein
VTFASWQSANQPGGAFNGDHDGDGVPNAVEYFLGGSGNTTGPTSLPSVVNDNGNLSVTWTKAVTYPGTYGTHFWVETSTTLTGAWTIETIGSQVVLNGQQVTFNFPAGGRRFVRLAVANLP